MHLTKEMILSRAGARTQEVPVPEWRTPEMAADPVVVIAEIGGLTLSRMWDWMAAVGRPPAGAVEALEARVTQLEQALRSLLAAGGSDEEAAHVAEQLLDRRLPDRILTVEENYLFDLRWCVAAVIDPATREPMFTLADLESLGRLDRRPIHRISEAAQALNRTAPAAQKDAEKNSVTTGDDASGSD